MAKLVLVVDDERVVAEMIGQHLKAAGYRAALAAGGREAQELIERDVPDLVITDFIMPEMDGLQLLEWMRDHRSMDNIKVILMTVKESAIAPIERYALAPDACLAKPMTSEELITSVQRLIGKP